MAQHRMNCAVYDPYPAHCTCDYDEQDLHKAYHAKIKEWETYSLQLAKQTEIWMKRAEYLGARYEGEQQDAYWKRIDAQMENM